MGSNQEEILTPYRSNLFSSDLNLFARHFELYLYFALHVTFRALQTEGYKYSLRF
jgi:hypothetical protein